eukprot:179294_1
MIILKLLILLMQTWQLHVHMTVIVTDSEQEKNSELSEGIFPHVLQAGNHVGTKYAEDITYSELYIKNSELPDSLFLHDLQTEMSVPTKYPEVIEGVTYSELETHSEFQGSLFPHVLHAEMDIRMKYNQDITYSELYIKNSELP